MNQVYLFSQIFRKLYQLLPHKLSARIGRDSVLYHLSCFQAEDEKNVKPFIKDRIYGKEISSIQTMDVTLDELRPG